jgi:hypothetical protein
MSFADSAASISLQLALLAPLICSSASSFTVNARSALASIFSGGSMLMTLPSPWTCSSLLLARLNSWLERTGLIGMRNLSGSIIR